jgi:hypothetical protein
MCPLSRPPDHMADGSANLLVIDINETSAADKVLLTTPCWENAKVR